MAGEQFWTYVLQNLQGRFYVGSTDDMDRRVQEHNDPDRARLKYTAKHGPWELVWSEPNDSRAEAMRRERQIKSMKSTNWIRETLLNESVERVLSMHRDRD